MMTLSGINFSLSTACSARCIFCPVHRGGKAPPHMSVDVVRNIVEQVQREPSLQGVKHFQCGENGDAFLNPQALDCLRTIRRHVPDAEIGIFTNFQRLDPGIAEILLEERLIDQLSCNIDGHDEVHYRAVKKTGLERARINIEAFLKLRNARGLKVPLHILSVNYNDYRLAIKRHFGFEPSNVKQPQSASISQDYKLICAQWIPKLNPQIDSIEPVRCFFSWAEREKAGQQPINYKRFTCPKLHRLRTEAFIAPDGRWYACCFDADCELLIGDTTQVPLIDLMHSPRRSELLRMLEAQRFGEIGGPCKTVNCCQLISLHPLETEIRRAVQSIRPNIRKLVKRLSFRSHE